MIDPAHNRARLKECLGGGLVVVSGYRAMQQTADMAAPFLQEANFLWLTAIDEPGWRAIIDFMRKRVTLVRPTRSRMQEIFDGGMTDEMAMKCAGADAVIEEKDFEGELRQLLRVHPLVYSLDLDQTSYEFVINPAPGRLYKTLERIFASVHNISKELAELRAIKSDMEILAIQKSVDITTKAFTSVREQFADYRNEYEVEAAFTHAFRRQNAQHGYEPIVANGVNATTLHYVKNSGKIAKNKLTVIDIGARVNGYNADITRTYAVNPTKRQIAVHAAVDRAHQRIIALLKPDLLIQDYLSSVDDIMKDALQDLGLLKNRDDDTTYRRYFPHAVSHGLGVDVHDSLGAPRYFKPGMVLTVEPGIYIPEESIGVRIEDDIVITKNGHRNLSGSLSTSL